MTACSLIDIPLLRPDRPMIFVAAAVLIDAENRVLLAQRPEGKTMAGLWEFPGGKVDENETPEHALVRELREELGIETSPGCMQPMTFASHPYEKFHLLMPLFGCRVWQGEPQPREGQKLAWASKHEWRDYPMPPADDRVLPILFEML
ncbi:MAG: (deoxy)nucleoside triphosphate pyrophosphohydrolase [Alphaproteobacteria bacterium]|nr:(deoxy)nucleoside triphosphate pyrophosphohydrolase [Alphaproteobacteria bacterium]